MRDFLYLTLVPSVCIATAVVTSHALAKKYQSQIRSKFDALKSKLSSLEHHTTAPTVVDAKATTETNQPK